VLDRITWFKQAALRWADGERTIYVDPWGTPADAPPADLILITHAHHDHFCVEDIARLATPATKLVAPRDVARELSGDVTSVAPGEKYEVGGVSFTTVPAYNNRPEALDFHPRAKGWVGYVLELGGAAYYHAGDTDHLPELESVRTDVAFVPVGGHFTMDPPQAGALVRAMSPALAVPFHYGFVVGSASDGERFREAASPVAVELMTPVRPFERR
jgi:L-ascorbate metabolism protein UlaG (beta-lactamase superfamily)